MKASFRTDDIRCGGCANNIRSLLGRHRGVTSVEVDARTKTIMVDFDSAAISREAISRYLADAGYAVRDASTVGA